MIEFGDSFVLGFHDVDELKFADHAIEFELGVLFEELLFFVVDCDSSEALNEVVEWDFVISFFLKEVVRVKHLFEIIFLEIRDLVLDLFEYFSDALLDIIGFGFDELGHHFLK